MTNLWGFGSPISLGQCCELSWSSCLAVHFPCYGSGLHSHWPNDMPLPPLLLMVLVQILIRSVWGGYLYSSWLCKIKLLGGACNRQLGILCMAEKTLESVTLPTIYFWEVSGTEPIIPSELVFQINFCHSSETSNGFLITTENLVLVVSFIFCFVFMFWMFL